MPRHGDLGQVVMNEYSALLLLSFFSVLMLLLFCCNYALDDCLDPQTPPRTRVWQDPGTRPHLILVFHSYKLMDAASKIRAYPFYSDTENHFFVPPRTAQDPVDAFLVFLIYWLKSSVSLKDTINCLEKAMKISHFNHIMIELCYFSLHQWEIKIHMLWGKCFNIPHWLRSHSTNGR